MANMKEAAKKAWATIRAKKRAAQRLEGGVPAIELAKDAIRNAGWVYYADKLKSGGYSIKPTHRSLMGGNGGSMAYPSTMLAVLDSLGTRKVCESEYSYAIRWVVK